MACSIIVLCRRSLIGLLAVATAVLILRLACIAGWFVPIRVASGSMAETLLGPHYSLRCADCRFPFRCGVDSPPVEGFLVCPNCGYRRNALGSIPVQSGTRIYVDRWPYLWIPPSRWDLVAFRLDSAGDDWGVKRVVGLPGERITLNQGDLYSNGAIVSKDWQDFQAMAVLVHDHEFRPGTSNLPARWQSDAEASAWTPDGSTFVFRPSQTVATSSEESTQAQGQLAIDWLTYRNWPCMWSPLSRTAESPVLDNDSYNQGESRPLSVVDDLMIVCHAELTGQGLFSLRIRSGGYIWSIQARTTDRQLCLFRDGTRTQGLAWPKWLKNGKHKWKLAVCDHRVMFAIDGRSMIVHPFEPLERSASTRPVSVGASGIIATISKLQVFRDVYYVDPSGLGTTWRTTVSDSPKHLLLFGDNSAISEDSRQWSDEGLPTQNIVGRLR